MFPSHAASFLLLTTLAGASNWSFTDVTAEVVDHNPPGIGPVFDYAFVDLNDDHLLDIVVNNHHHAKPSPVWLGTPNHKFAFWGNMPSAWVPIAGFHLGEVDQDGDGKTDLVCTGNEGGVIINLNRTPQGSHQLSFDPVPVHSSSHLVSFIDLDTDGELETLIRPGQIFTALTGPPTHTGIQFGNWTIADFDNDSWPDLFAAGAQSRRAHWTGPRNLFRNHHGTLQKSSLPASFETTHIGGIPKAADFDNDGNFDLYLFGATDTSTGDNVSMRLYLGDGKLGFRDVSASAGISTSTQKPGYSHVYLADIDNDSHTDLVNQGNYGTVFWRNNGDATFTALPKSQTATWNANAHMRLDDYDMDGRLDIVTSDVGPGWKDRPRSVRVFRNTTQNDNHWLKLQLRQPGGNPMAIGATVTITDPTTKKILGKKMLYADTEGYHPRLHFGLGNHSQVDIAVTFPTTRETVHFPAVAADHYLVLRPDRSIETLKPGAKTE